MTAPVPKPRSAVGDEALSLKLWAFAGIFVCAAHAAGISAGLFWERPRPTTGDAPPAIMVELAPLAIAPEPTELDIAPGPLMMEAKPQAEPEPKPKLEEKLEIPELPKKEEAEVTLPAPAPEKKEEEKPKPKPEVQEPPKKKEVQKLQAPQTTAPPKAKLRPAPRMAAPSAGATENSAFANANWRGAIVAHLNRFKRFPAGASNGTAVVAFSIDASGRVTSARLARSSGNPTLDSDAVAMVWRANPVPAPPPSVSKGRGMALSVPVHYVRR
jgi:protein TonB